MESKRFVVRKNLVGKGEIINVTTKKGKTYSYNHDDVYEANKDKLDQMNCFIKYKSYTSTESIPTFARSFVTDLVEPQPETTSKTEDVKENIEEVVKVSSKTKSKSSKVKA